MKHYSDGFATHCIKFRIIISGGCTIVGTPRLAQANNPKMPEGRYDPEKPTSYIQFLDFNSLYPSIMADFPLPTYGFKWLTKTEIDNFNLSGIAADSDTGYILVCDLECPEEIHDKFDAFPMCPENVTVGVDDVSPYTKELAAACNMNLRPSKKLCLTLAPKKHYAVHYLTLQCYLRHGMVLTQIHKVLSFRQSLWLQDFMKFTTEKRRSATNEFDGMLYKSVGCNVFGKSIENVKQRINVKIVTSAQKLRRLVNKPSFQAVRVFDSNMAAVQLYREKVKLNKPIAVGFTVLELAKMKMYDFWYDVLLEAFKDFKVSLLMSDTDSFLVHLESVSASASDDSVMTILQDYKDKFDLSKLEEGNPLRDDKNRQIPGKMKLQLPNETCMEAVVLSSKCYSILTDKGSLAAMKGVPGRLQHEVYKECILNDKCHVGRIRSVKHFGQSLYHVSTERRMLSPIDMKRYYLSANESLSYGHYRLRDVVN
ncbi:MAG: hypothetical protein AB2693_01235 [Candidatus Thiodiazotropha sp.]